jgi:hypothetical protein
MRKLIFATCFTLASSLAAPLTAFAQPVPVAVVTTDPQVAIFDGTNAISLPGEQSLNLTDVSTIEFWVKPNWTRLSYAPVILSAFADEAVRYAIVMTANKKAIGLYSGGDWDYVEFDFDDGKSHHVAFVNMGELTDVYIDGEMIDSISQPIADIPVRTFHIGSINGFDSQFIGTIGEVRLWDSALDGDDIAQFMRVHIFSTEGLTHPDLINLVGVSDFANRRRNFTLVNNTSTMDELFTDSAIARGDLPPAPAENKPIVMSDGTVIPPLTPEELATLEELRSPPVLPPLPVAAPPTPSTASKEGSGS